MTWQYDIYNVFKSGHKFLPQMWFKPQSITMQIHGIERIHFCWLVSASVDVGQRGTQTQHTHHYSPHSSYCSAAECSLNVELKLNSGVNVNNISFRWIVAETEALAHLSGAWGGEKGGELRPDKDTETGEVVVLGWVAIDEGEVVMKGVGDMMKLDRRMTITCLFAPAC